ncbi:MAG: hypothetical protein KJ648_07610 [Candidatus Omnitrophica bacterium]|nr:hypothetical protein [Candidatus Omnitrophota bacterium]
MNYTERIRMLMVQAGLPPRWNQTTERDLVALMQEANREAIAELHQAHSAEMLAHIETKRELRVRLEKAEEKLWAAHRNQERTDEELRETRLARDRNAEAARFVAASRQAPAAFVAEVQERRDYERDCHVQLNRFVKGDGKPYDEKGSLKGRIETLVHECFRMEREILDLREKRDAAVKRADENQRAAAAFASEAQQAEAARRNAFKEVRKELEAELMTASALCASCPKQAADEARDQTLKKLEASLRAQEKLEKKIAGFREVLSPFKHLLEDL